MAKLTLTPNPTFKLSVPFPLAGAEPVPVQLTFRHRGRTALAEFMKPNRDRTDVDSFMDMVTAWNLEDEFNRANVERLLDNHLGVAVAVFNAYVRSLVDPAAVPKEWFTAAA